MRDRVTAPASVSVQTAGCSAPRAQIATDLESISCTKDYLVQNSRSGFRVGGRP